MELNVKEFSKETLLNVTRELSRDNTSIRKLTLGLAGVDSTDCVTSIDYEERCAALEGLIEFFIEERKKVIKYLDSKSLDNEGLNLLQKMEKDYE